MCRFGNLKMIWFGNGLMGCSKTEKLLTLNNLLLNPCPETVNLKDVKKVTAYCLPSAGRGFEFEFVFELVFAISVIFAQWSRKIYQLWWTRD